MNLREQLNTEHYRQAVQFADHFAEPERSAFLQETEARRAFEQAHILQNSSEKRPLVRLFLGLFGLVFVVALLFYGQTGRYQAVLAGVSAFEQFQQVRQAQPKAERNESYILNLQNRLRENPNDGDLWFELAQAYALDNEFENAMICYRNAEGILGRTAPILSGMATAAYYQNRHQLTPQIQVWLDEALTKDGKESGALLLLASDAFWRNDFATAVRHWEAVLDSENEQVDRREIIRNVQEAKSRLGQ